jgi:hypothetical protein
MYVHACVLYEVACVVSDLCDEMFTVGSQTDVGPHRCHEGATRLVGGRLASHVRLERVTSPRMYRLIA